MKKNKIAEYLFLAYFGGCTYCTMEVFYRGYSHWSMFIVGAICLLAIGSINEIFPWDMYIEVQALIGSAIITTLEFLCGCIVNLYLGWNVWDYSDVPFNYKGQICIYGSMLWFMLSFVAIIADDYLRHYIFHEKKPHYRSIIRGG